MEWVAEWVQKAAVQGFHYIRIWAQLYEYTQMRVSSHPHGTREKTNVPLRSADNVVRMASLMRYSPRL
jgi:hypothetical protein